ncbi:MAG: gliding motility-associated C-terminal domain-containing protein [Saprospiraceae bacterium]
MYKVKHLLFSLLFLVLCATSIRAQEFNGCITIDFETLPTGTPFEGALISDQYFADFGLTFELENGNPPVLAEVGNPTTAFGSVYGNDTPEPNQGIGSFFLTDDGLLSGLNAIPLYLNFETPIDSFSGCILDMDFGELFIIEARDINGDPLLIDTIVAGDPGTGDGLATCWGFNFGGCTGTVYSIRFEGKRETAGAFGLGMDNFSFCTGGVDIANEIVVDSEPLSCTNELSAITILNTGSEDFTYSIDGINFQDEPFFDDLTDGLYTVTVKDPDGCIATFDIDIAFYFEPIIVTANPGNTTCGENNGTITVNSDASNPVEYSINGTDFQISNSFTDVPPGTYTVTVMDNFGCSDETTVTIEPSSSFFISASTTIDDTCNDSEGSIIINGTQNGTGDITYAISTNPGVFQPNNTFTNLPAGTYTITAIDELGCEDETEVTIEGGIFILEEVIPDIQNLTCTSNLGSITMVTNGTNAFTYSIDGGLNFQSNPLFDDLPLGSYVITILDANGCTDDVSATIAPYVDLNIIDLIVEQTTCGEDNGAFTIIANNANGIEYAINEGEFQTENSFDSLPPNLYQVLITDEDGCTATGEVTIDPSFPPMIEGIDIGDNYCDSLIGTIGVNAVSGTGTLSYFLNNDTIPGPPSFVNLDGGEYLVTVIDEAGCIAMDTVTIITTPPVELPDVLVQQPDCDAINGVVQPLASGGSGILWYTLNNGLPTPLDSFTNLAVGTYSIFVEDEFGCTNEAVAMIPYPRCEVYIPNVFTPNGDGVNDFFKIFTTRLYDVDVLSYDIYDRWGEHVWSSEAFTINTGRTWWGGIFKGQKAMIDVYAYVIRVRHLDGTEEFFKGDVTLVR